ncbi:MAG: ComEC/Rec2 family competence protein [Alphaproteobacteria bacterium]|nr:ComEC/Rec2 family competence protein [Alphaproteobacteria bacterium]
MGILMDWNALFPHERRILWLPVLLGAGVALYFSLPEEPPLRMVTLWGLVCMMFWWRAGRYRWIIMALAVMCAGFAGAQTRMWILDAPALHKPTRTVTLTGTIDDVVHLDSGYRLIVRDATAESQDTLPPRIQVRFRGKGKDAGLAAGQKVEFKARLYPPPLPALPGGFDFARNDYFKRIGAVGFAFGSPTVVEGGECSPSPCGGGSFIDSLRARWTQRIVSQMDAPYGGLAAAMMTGEQDRVSDDIVEQWRAAGISHLISISGLHIGLVAGLIFVLFRRVLAFIPRIALYHDTKKWAAAASIAGGFAYLLISGMPVPAQRSYIMAVFFLLAILIDRTHTPMRIIAWAATLILLIFPESMMGASFQLSFAATLAIIALYEGYMRRQSGEHFVPVEHTLPRRFGNYLWGIMATSVAATIATTPYAIYHFHTFSFYGLVANMAAIPLTSFLVMPAAVAAFLLMPLGLEELALAPMQWGLEAIVAMAEYIHGLPASIIAMPPLPTWGIALVTAGGLWFCLWKGRVRWWGVLPALVGMGSMLLYNTPDMLIGEKNIAVVSEQGIALLAKRRPSFTEKNWMEELGYTRFTPREDVPGLQCEGDKCRLEVKGTRVAVVFAPAIPEMQDCAENDLIIGRGRKEPEGTPCPDKTLFIRDYLLWTRGTHALRWDEDGKYKMETSADRQGKRKWSRKR